MLSLREFLGLSLEERTPDHSTLSKTRRLLSRTSKALVRRHGERIERGFSHLYGIGGPRWVQLRETNNVAKRLLIHAAAFNLSLMLRRRAGDGSLDKAFTIVNGAAAGAVGATAVRNYGLR